ncbi:MAG: hypothetical protein ACI3Z5_05335 [Paludibacteraceae bacterium]
MKKLVSLSMLLVMSFSLYAQERDVTRFLGIPVDGSKKDMIQKLKAKGFESSSIEYPDVLTGEFNGNDVNIHVVTNNNKVWRIMVADVNGKSETDIKIRFNNLCRQFENNKKYTPVKEDQIISQEENLSYEMNVNNKRYEAIFYQNAIVTDSVAYVAEEMQNLVSLVEDTTNFFNNRELRKSLVELKALQSMQNKSVWFMINQIYGKYYIVMYYDNEYNHANGEDL